MPKHPKPWTRNLRYKLTPKRLKILKLLFLDKSQTDISRILNKSQTTIYGHVQALIKMGLIKESFYSSYKSYELTKQGIAIYKENQEQETNHKHTKPYPEGVPNTRNLNPIPSIRAHDLQFKSLINKYPENYLKIAKKYGFKEIEVKNWFYLQKDYNNVVVQLKPNCVVYCIKNDIESKDPQTAIFEATKLISEAKEKLEAELWGIHLSTPEILNYEPINGHYAIPGDPFAKLCELNKENIQFPLKAQRGRVLVDRSKGIAETETTVPKLSQDDAQAYLNKLVEPVALGELDPKQLQNTLGIFISVMTQYVQIQNNLTKVLTKLNKPKQEPTKPPTHESKPHIPPYHG